MNLQPANMTITLRLTPVRPDDLCRFTLGKAESPAFELLASGETLLQALGEIDVQMFNKFGTSLVDILMPIEFSNMMEEFEGDGEYLYTEMSAQPEEHFKIEIVKE